MRLHTLRSASVGLELGGRLEDEPSVRTRGYRDDFFLKVLAAPQAGDQATLAAVLRRQRVYLLTELHVRADLGVAEHDLTPGALAALRFLASPAPPE